MLFEEIEDVLARPAFREVIGEEAIDRFLAGLLAIVEWVEDPKGVAAAVSRDPDDDYLVALADSAGADLLLSGDRDQALHAEKESGGSKQQDMSYGELLAWLREWKASWRPS